MYMSVYVTNILPVTMRGVVPHYNNRIIRVTPFLERPHTGYNNKHQLTIQKNLYTTHHTRTRVVGRCNTSHM